MIDQPARQPEKKKKKGLIVRQRVLQMYGAGHQIKLTSFISRTPLSCVQISRSCWISVSWDWERVCSWDSRSSLWARAWLNSLTHCSDWPSDVSNLEAREQSWSWRIYSMFQQRYIFSNHICVFVFVTRPLTHSHLGSWSNKCVGTYSFTLSPACWMSFRDCCNLKRQ